MTTETKTTWPHHVPIEQWGSDHWDALTYVEARVVNHGGVLKHPNMRTDPGRHPRFYDIFLKPLGMMISNASDGSRYPTRLINKQTREHHDDWDCLFDMVAEGLVTLVNNKPLKYWQVEPGHRGPLRSPNSMGPIPTMRLPDQKVKLTEYGSRLVAQLRRQALDRGQALGLAGSGSHGPGLFTPGCIARPAARSSPRGVNVAILSPLRSSSSTIPCSASQASSP